MLSSILKKIISSKKTKKILKKTIKNINSKVENFDINNLKDDIFHFKKSISEIDKFNQKDWWNEDGSYKMLHQINQLRIDFILNNFHFEVEKQDKSKIKIIDIGCGGGILTEPFAKLGFNVTGIDANSSAIQVAIEHSKLNGFDINYINQNFEEYAMKSENHEVFDLVIASEIIEHIEDQESFISNCSKILKVGGMIFLSTINKNIYSLICAKIAAEYVFKIIPCGTHDFRKFIKPSTICGYLEKSNIEIVKMCGINFNLKKLSFTQSEDLKINYFIIGKKIKSTMIL